MCSVLGSGGTIRLIRSLLLLKSSVGSGKTSNRHPKRRAGDIIKPNLVAEDDRCGVTAMLAADSDLQILAS